MAIDIASLLLWSLRLADLRSQQEYSPLRNGARPPSEYAIYQHITWLCVCVGRGQLRSGGAEDGVCAGFKQWPDVIIGLMKRGKN